MASNELRVPYTVVTNVGLKGLYTNDSPASIPDQALADALNIDFSGSLMGPRMGTDLFFTKPVGETGAPLQAFKFIDSVGREYLLSRYGSHFYVYDPGVSGTPQWVRIDGPGVAGNIPATKYYRETFFSGGVGADRAFFAHEAGATPVVYWNPGIDYLLASTPIGSLFVTISSAAHFQSFLNPVNGVSQFLTIGGANYGYNAKGSIIYPVVSVTNGSNAVTFIVGTTAILSPGMTLAGTGIPGGTVVSTIIDATNFTISNNSSVTNASLGVTISLANTFWLDNATTATYAVNTPVVGAVNSSQIPINATVVAVWQQSICAAYGSTFVMSAALNPDNFSFGSPYSSAHQIVLAGGNITDLQPFGKFILAGQQDGLQVLELQTSNQIASGVLVVNPYLAGVGIGPVSPTSSIQYNNTYFYPTSANGIMSLNPSFTGSASSSTEVKISSDVIHDLFKNLTFFRANSRDRKVYWIADQKVGLETKRIALVHDFLREGWTIYDNWDVTDLVNYGGGLYMLSAGDGNLYSVDVDFTDFEEATEVGYDARALTKRFDFGAPANPKTCEYLYVEGTIGLGTTMYVDVLYNEGGSLGQQRFKIVGSTANAYISVPQTTNENNPQGRLTQGDPLPGDAYYRAYLSLDQHLVFYNIQAKFYSSAAGSNWGVSTIAWNPKVTEIPQTLVISPS